jgi:hypothetical protein
VDVQQVDRTLKRALKSSINLVGTAKRKGKGHENRIKFLSSTVLPKNDLAGQVKTNLTVIP